MPFARPVGKYFDEIFTIKSVQDWFEVIEKIIINDLFSIVNNKVKRYIMWQ